MTTRYAGGYDCGSLAGKKMISGQLVEWLF